jgi:hypothetical protein
VALAQGLDVLTDGGITKTEPDRVFQVV